MKYKRPGSTTVKKCTGRRILGKWSNMIGYETGSSPVGVYTAAKISLLETFKHGWENNTVVN
jgi:hypothetical protein